MLITDAALKNRTTVMVIVLIIALAGGFSYVTLPRESAPDVPVPLVQITTVYEGVAPQDVETAITMKIEQELTGLDGLEQISSTSREGTSFIVVEFSPDTNIKDALQDVRDKVDLAKAELPADAEEPVLTEINLAELPIMLINISGPISPVRLKAIADDLEEAIERVPGVLDVNVLGALEREIRLEFDPDRLAAYGLTAVEMLALIPGENVNISAGGLETPGTKFNVRVPAEFVRPEEVDHLLLTVRDGRPIYLSDVAVVRDTFKDRDSIARLDGEPSVTISVSKRIGANIVQIATIVKAILAEAQAEMPAGVEVNLTMDQSDEIHTMLLDLENNVLSALVLVVLVLMLFLGVRTSVIVALAIPLSMLMSFAILDMLGVTLNMIVLFSLILALGMLVDNAIVIVENIYRHMQEGAGRLEAASRGTAEVAWPVVTSTLTTVAAFAPLLLWPGIVGDFMQYLPLTVIVVLSSSLFVALVINPVAAAMFAKPPTRRMDDVHDNWFSRSYRRVLVTALRHRFTTIALALLLLAGVIITFGKYNHGVLFFPDLDPAEGIINIRAPQGTSLEMSDLLARMAEQRVSPFGEHIKHVSTQVGYGGDIWGDSSGGPHVTNVTLVFRDFELRERPSAEVIAELRESMRDIPGAEVKVSEPQAGPPTGDAITVEIAGDDFETLARLNDQAYELLSQVPGVVNLRSDYEARKPELQFIVDRRRAMLLGVNSASIGQFLKTAVLGVEVGTYRQFSEEYDITVRLPESARRQIDDLFRLHVPDVNGNPVPLSSLGEFRYASGYGDIHRLDQKRVITITGDVEGRQNEAARSEAIALLNDSLDLPRGYTITFAGEKEEQDKAVAFLRQAYILAVLIILMILVTQFNTLGIPLIILVTVALSVIGVLAGLLVTGLEFVILMTGIGVVSLAGVVVNNAIVLLDYTRQLERRGLGLMEAATQAGMTRLRPVLLTAITTMLSLVPMATGVSFNFRALEWATRSESSAWWQSLAVAVIFGLGFATLLTLVVVPTLYVSLYRLLERFGLGGLKRGAIPLQGGSRQAPASDAEPAGVQAD